MRIVFSSSPFAGHLFPLLPLARAAHEGGHDTAVLSSEPLASALDPGIEVLPAGPMPDVLLAEVARRTGTDPTRDNAPEIVAELFAGTRVDLGLILQRIRGHQANLTAPTDAAPPSRQL